MVTSRLLLLEALLVGAFAPGCGGVASEAGATGGADPAQSGGVSPSPGGYGTGTSVGGSAAAGTVGEGEAGGGGIQTGSGGTVALCSDVEPCGGDVVGIWTAVSSCLVLSGEIDVMALGVGCSSMPVTGSLEVSGTWTANADGTYADDLTWAGLNSRARSSITFLT